MSGNLQPRPKLAKLLKEYGIRQTGRDLGIEHSRLFRWKNGEGVTFIDDAIALADYFDTTVEEIFKKGRRK